MYEGPFFVLLLNLLFLFCLLIKIQKLFTEQFASLLSKGEKERFETMTKKTLSLGSNIELGLALAGLNSETKSWSKSSTAVHKSFFEMMAEQYENTYFCQNNFRKFKTPHCTL